MLPLLLLVFLNSQNNDVLDEYEENNVADGLDLVDYSSSASSTDGDFEDPPSRTPLAPIPINQNTTLQAVWHRDIARHRRTISHS